MPRSDDGGAADATLFDGGTVSQDTTPPVFAGASMAKVVDQSDIAVTWAAATDNVTPPSSIAYRVYIATTSGKENFSTPVVTSPAGATGTLITSLMAWTTYYIVVRAVDQAGNEDTNTVEVTAKTTDVTPPVFAGIQSLAPAGGTSVTATWNAAVDNGSAQSQVSYNLYVSTTQGGEDFTTPTMAATAGTTTATVTGLQQVETVFVVVRAVDAAGNEDKNKRELSTRTLDTTAPSFHGLTSATAVGTVINLQWAAATDLLDDPSEIVYEVFQSTSSMGESYAKPSYVTAAGATSLTVENLDVSTTYYFVVRAKDTSGNVDGNTDEQSATTAAHSDVTPPSFAGLVSAVGLSDTTVDLSWAAATDNVTPQNQIVYDIFVAAASGAETYGAASFTTAPGATAYTIQNLQPLQTIYVVVRARDLVGNEDANTVEKSAPTLADTTPPTFAGLASATPISDQAIQLSWLAATDDVSAASNITYRVYQGTTRGGEGTTPVATTSAGQTTMSIGGLAPKTAYFFIVRAVDQAGNQDHNSVEESATTFPDTTPPTFAGVTGLISTSPTTLTASWTTANDDVTPAVSIVYLPYIATSAGGENLTAAVTPTSPGATSYTFTGLVPDKTYYVIVRAEDAAGNVDRNTNELNFATQQDVTPPTFAGASQVTGATDSTLTVAWNAATDAITPPAQIAYDVCISSSNGGCSGASFTASFTVTGGLSHPFTGLTPMTPYYFVVRAKDQYGVEDSNSNQVSGTTVRDTTPPTFAGLTGATSTSPTTITLNWSPGSDDVTPPGSLVYDIFQASASMGETFGGPTYTTSAGATSYVVTGLLPQQTWYYVVRARDVAGNDDGNTVEHSAKVQQDKTPPTFGGITSLTATGLTSLLAQWNTATSIVPPNSAIAYEVCWSSMPGNPCGSSFSPMVTTAPGALSYSITGLPDNTPYTVVVRAADPYGNVDSNTNFLTTSTLPDTTPPSFNGGTPSVTGESATTITLSWPLATDNYDAQASLTYEVCIALAPAVCTGGSFIPNQTLTNLTTSPASYTFTGLQNLQTYNFVVRVKDSAGNDDGNNNQVSGQTVHDTTPPTFPSGDLQSATAESDSTILLTWNIATDNVSAATQITYDIYQAGTMGGEADCTQTPTYSVTGTTGPSQSYLVQNLQPLTPYYFVVRARDSANNRSCGGTEKTATTFRDQTPPTFAGVTSVSVVSDTQLTASWSAATDDTTPQSQIVYQVCYSTSASACTTSFTAMATTAGGATSYTPLARTLIPNMNYTFVVRAVDLSNNVDTNTATANNTTLVDNPPAFTWPGSATAITDTSATINWTAATDDYTTAANMVYEICLTTSSNGCSGGAFSSGIVGSVTGTTSFNLTGLTPLKPYYVIVRAENEPAMMFNTTNANTQLNFSTATDPTVPTFGGLTNATVGGSSSVTLTWNQATDSSGFTTNTQFTYNVYGGGTTPPTTFTSPVASLSGYSTTPISYTVSGLTPDVVHCYIVRAESLYGVSDSNTVSFCETTDYAPPVLGTPIVTAVSTSELDVAYSATTSPTTGTIDYYLCDAVSPGTCTPPGTLTSSGTSGVTQTTKFTGLAANTTYDFVIKATTNGGFATTTASGKTQAAPPTLSGSVACSTVAAYPTYVSISYPAAVAGSYPVSGYQICFASTSSNSGSNPCLSSFTNYIPSSGHTTFTSETIGQAVSPEVAPGGTVVTLSSPLTSFDYQWIAVRAVDSQGTVSSAIGNANLGTCVTSASYTTDVYDAYVGSAGAGGCPGCHNGSYEPGPWSLSYWQNAANKPTECTGTFTQYMAPDSIGASFLYQKLAGTQGAACGSQMPEGGTAASAAYKRGTYLSMMASWIDESTSSLQDN